MSFGLFSLARMTVASSGTGTITLNAAVPGFLTFDLAGCSTNSSGQLVTYAINDTTQSEIARGTYFSSAATLVRGSSQDGMKSTNSDSPINMSNAAQVFITPAAEDLNDAFGQCYLSAPTATVLTLSTYNGNKLTINSRTETIPINGVELYSSAAGLTSSTYYYVYAYMNSSIMSLEVSTTVYTAQDGTGVFIKTGDNTRTLVGLTFSTTAASGSSTWSQNELDTASWYNPEPKTDFAGGNPTTIGTSNTEFSTGLRVGFVTFSGRMVSAYYQMGSYSNTVANQDNTMFLSLDSNSSVVFVPAVATRNAGITGSESYNGYQRVDSVAVSEGRHYITAFGSVSGGQLSINNWRNVVITQG